MFRPIVKWQNGSQNVFSDIYSEFLSDEEFETESEAQSKADELFPEWRKSHPENDGWKARAWPSSVELPKNEEHK